MGSGRIFTVFFLLLGLSGSLLAQEKIPDTIQIQSVQVTSELMYTRADQVAGPLSLIRPGQLRAENDIQAAAYLHRIPGISLQQGTLTTNRIVIRGIGSRSPYATNRIRMYLGDIPVTDGNGESSVADLLFEDIRYMEVLRGPSSAIYGPGLGGVIRLVPDWPEQDTAGLHLQLSTGSYGRLKWLAEPTYSKGRWDLKLGLSGFRLDGYRENSSFDRNNVSLLSRYRGTRTTLSLFFQAADVRGEIPSSLAEEDYIHKPWSAASNWLAVSGFEDYRRLRSGISMHHYFSPVLISKTVLFGSLYDLYESRPFNILELNSQSGGFRQELILDRSTTTVRAGAEGRLESSRTETFVTLQGEQGARKQSARFTHRELNGFFLLSQEMGPNWLIESGVNLGFSNHLVRPVLSPRIGLGYTGMDPFYIYFSAGHGFSTPTLEESLLPDGQLNPDIRPERGWSFDLGLRGLFRDPALTFDVNLYHILLTDLIVTKRISEDQFMGVNAGQTAHSGLEAEFIWTRGMIELQSGGYVGRFIFREFEEEGITYDGNALPGVPSLSWFARVDGRPSKPADFYLEARLVGRQYLTDDNQLMTPSHYVINAGMSREFSIRQWSCRVYLGVKNLLNASYPSMVLVNAPSFGGTAPRYYYPAPGRNYFIGWVVDL